MRPVAFEAALLRHVRRAFAAIGFSGAFIGVISLAKAAGAVMSDVCANCAQDVLNGWAGRTGEWLILGALFAAFTLHARRANAARDLTAPRVPTPRLRLGRARYRAFGGNRARVASTARDRHRSLCWRG